MDAWDTKHFIDNLHHSQSQVGEVDMPLTIFENIPEPHGVSSR